MSEAFVNGLNALELTSLAALGFVLLWRGSPWSERLRIPVSLCLIVSGSLLLFHRIF